MSTQAQNAKHQTTKERCRIFHVGLNARETLVIESLFRSNPDLSTRYIFGPPAATDTVDLLFVNGDDPLAVSTWAEEQRQRPELVAIVVCSEEREFGAANTLRKPLDFRNVAHILDAITSTDISGFDMLPASSDTLRVMVVDDSFPARQYMRLKLDDIAAQAGLKLHVDLVESGEQALELAGLYDYDLAFLDVVMPGLDGYEACRRLKALRPMRVAMLSSRAAMVDFTKGREAGCDNYLPKPANDTDLRTVLRLTALKKTVGGVTRT